MQKELDRHAREQDLDDFWNIERLMPQKSISVRTPRQSSHVDATEIELDAPKVNIQQQLPVQDAPLSITRSEQTQATPAKKAQEVIPERVYSPKHPLISQVRVLPWRSNFSFYERFCAMATELYGKRGQPCQAVPFFSYMPQYDQMNRAQLSWYFYWRDRVRAGEYLDTDYSYIFLFLFEIINLPDEIKPEKGQLLLCEIWKHYRKVYPLLNRYLADWICDYSLIHQLPPPAELLADMLPIIAEQSSFKEFYACPTGDDAGQDARIYLLFCTNYNYRKSKLYLAGSAQATAMNTHIPAAISFVVRELEREGIVFAETKMQRATLSRDSFIGALTSGRMKRRIEVDYCSFHRSHELRFLITDMIKYTENRLRSFFGMKSKLSIYALPDRVKEKLDVYLAQALPARNHSSDRAKQTERPAYEALYDLPKTELRADLAAEIEQSSWEITKQLVEAFEQDGEEQVVAPTIPDVDAKQVTPAAMPETELCEALRPYASLLDKIAKGDVAGQHAIAKAQGCLLDAISEKINTIASDIMGDILMEEDGQGGYALIEDYRDEIAPLLNG